jgi:hypothetical protein
LQNEGIQVEKVADYRTEMAGGGGGRRNGPGGQEWVIRTANETCVILIKGDEFWDIYSSLVTLSSAHACLTLTRTGVLRTEESPANTLQDIPKVQKRGKGHRKDLK